MKIRLSLSLTVGRDKHKATEDVTADLVGTHRDIPTASYGAGFQPDEDRR